MVFLHLITNFVPSFEPIVLQLLTIFDSIRPVGHAVTDHPRAGFHTIRTISRDLAPVFPCPRTESVLTCWQLTSNRSACDTSLLQELGSRVTCRQI